MVGSGPSVTPPGWALVRFPSVNPGTPLYDEFLPQPVGGAQIKFQADLEAPAKARRDCTDRTRGVVSHDVASTACLLVSELVSNTVRHGDCQPDDTIEVLIDRDPDSLRVAVCQRAAIGALQVARDREAREGGWGLMLVDELAQEWGVDDDPNCVWFKLAA